MYQRILLKLSGEALAGVAGAGSYDRDFVEHLIDDLIQVRARGIKIAIVIGGGNIFRGVQKDILHLRQSSADEMGMLATLMNGIALRECLEQKAVPVQLLSALPCPTLCATYTPHTARQAFEQDMVVLCVGGSSVPYFTTDTAAVIRAQDLECDVILKGTKVEGIFSADPATHPDATHYASITYADVLDQRLAVMDMTALELARSAAIPIVVFSVFQFHPITSVLDQKCRFTQVSRQ